MKPIITLTFLALAITVAQASEKLSILIIDGQNNHNWRATSPVIKAGLEETGRYKVEVSTSPQKGEN